MQLQTPTKPHRHNLTDTTSPTQPHRHNRPIADGVDHWRDRHCHLCDTAERKWITELKWRSNTDNRKYPTSHQERKQQPNTTPQWITRHQHHTPTPISTASTTEVNPTQHHKHQHTPSLLRTRSQKHEPAWSWMAIRQNLK